VSCRTNRISDSVADGKSCGGSDCGTICDTDGGPFCFSFGIAKCYTNTYTNIRSINYRSHGFTD